MFAEGCQKGQKAINADHLYKCYLIINWINKTDRDRRKDKRTDRNEYTYN